MWLEQGFRMAQFRWSQFSEPSPFTLRCATFKMRSPGTSVTSSSSFVKGHCAIALLCTSMRTTDCTAKPPLIRLAH